MWLFHLRVHFQLHRSDPGETLAPTNQVPDQVLPELLVPTTVDHRAQETGDDVDDQEKDVSDLQTH